MEFREIALITTTCGDAAVAERLVTHVIERRLAACGQIDADVRSRYHWAGEIASDTECRCTFKTSVLRAEACAAGILAVHAYDTPELTVATVMATAAYADWIDATVDPGLAHG